MTGSSERILSPAEALEVQLDMAVGGKGGAFAGAYDAWYDTKYKSLERAARQAGQEPNVPQINAAIAGSVDEWKQSARDTWNQAQENEGKGINITDESAQGFMASLLSGNLQGALIGLGMQLAPVQKFISTLVTYIGSKIGSMFSKDTQSLSWAEARAQVESNADMRAGATALQEAGFGSAREIAEVLNNTKATQQAAAAETGAGTPITEAQRLEIERAREGIARTGTSQPTHADEHGAPPPTPAGGDISVTIASR